MATTLMLMGVSLKQKELVSSKPYCGLRKSGAGAEREKGNPGVVDVQGTREGSESERACSCVRCACLQQACNSVFVFEVHANVACSIRVAR